ncbi:hypothetical protein QTP70_030023, partial [Hemibagrus guttatus]
KPEPGHRYTCNNLGPQQNTRLQALRKEKSRDAARSRRGKENFEFYELAKMLPLPGAITSQLDKASIIRLTISYLKMRDFANQGDPPWNLRVEGPPPNTSVKAIGSQRRRSPSAVASEIFEPHLGSHILQPLIITHEDRGICEASFWFLENKPFVWMMSLTSFPFSLFLQSLDGFVFALNKEGRFLYISETVSIYLGLSQLHSADIIFGIPVMRTHQNGPREGYREERNGGMKGKKEERETAQEGEGLTTMLQARFYGYSLHSINIFTVELTGSSAFDYVHPGDQVEMAEQLGMKLPPGRSLLSQGAGTEDGASSASSSSHSETPEPDYFSQVESSSPSHLSPDNTLERSFFIRMKSTLTKRGVHIKSSGYKVIHITGRLRIRMALTHNRTVPNQIMGMVVVAHALPPPTINEVRIDCHMFVTRVNMDLNIVYCENRISDYMDLTPVDIIGKRCYQFIHAEDVEGIRHSHLDLMNKGQCVTKYYRWIQKNGGYIWIQSSATIAINAKNANEKNIIWVNYVLSNPEYKDTPMDITQLPNLPEKASESSETSDSESDSKDNSEDNENSKSDGKGNQSSENSEEPESDSKKPTRHSEQEMRHQEEDSSSNAESQESEDSLEPSDCEAEHKESRLAHLSGLPIKVEHYGDGEGAELHNSLSSSSEEEDDDEEEEEEDNDEIMKDYNSEGELSGPLTSKRQKRKKRRKKQKWEGSRQRLRLSPPEDVTASPGSLEPALGEQPPLLPPPSPTTASVLKIKTEMAEPINFDNDSSIWNFPPNREISRNESPFSMTKHPSGHETFPAAIPDSVLTPPGTEGGAGIRKPNFTNSSSSSSSNSAPTSAGLAPPLSNSSSSDPLSPPLSASPRDKQQGTPTSQNSLLYSGDLEALQRLQTGNVVLPLVQRVAGTLAATSTAAAPRVYTAGTIRYAPADVTLAVQGNLLPSGHAAVNFVDVNGPGFGIDAKTPMEMLYHHVHRLNMSGPFGGAGTGASLAQMPTANVFTTAEGLFSTLPFPVYSNGIHTTQTLERKED